MNIELTENEIVFLKQYASVYKQERDLDCTADPIVVVEDIEEFVAPDGYGDKAVFVWDECSYSSLTELKKELKENKYSKNNISMICDDLEYYGHCEKPNIQKHSIHITYRPIAYFLTRAEADKYIKYQSHNLREPRVYTRSCGYANYGDLQCLYQLLLKMGQQLNKKEGVGNLEYIEKN